MIRFSDSDSTHPSYSVPYFQEGYVHYVVDAVFALVLSIQHLFDEKCSQALTRKGICPEFFPLDGTRLLTLLRNVSFRNGNFDENNIEMTSSPPRRRFLLELSRRLIRFTSNGDGIGTYDIFQYQMIDSSDTLDYLSIGEFSDSHPNNER